MTFSSKIPWLASKVKEPVVSLTEQLTRALLKGKRVLFLDDDLPLRGLVERAASEYEIQLIGAETSGQARKMIAEEEPFDAAILDVNVVNGDGIAFYQWLKEQHPRTQVVFLTGANVEAVADKVHAIGSAPVYGKPNFVNAAFMSDLFEKLGCRRKATPA